MRKNVLGIYKALRHFGASAKEVDALAKAYKVWLNFQYEELLSIHLVYCLQDYLVSMPFRVKALHNANRLIGVEINKIIFIANMLRDVSSSEVNQYLTKVKKDFLSLKLQGADIDVELPTAKEAKILLDKVRNSWCSDCPEIYHLDGCIWIKPQAETPEKTVAKVVSRGGNVFCEAFCPDADTRAILCPIIHPRKGVDIIGKFDRFGIPTPQTRKMYYLLLESLY